MARPSGHDWSFAAAYTTPAAGGATSASRFESCKIHCRVKPGNDGGAHLR